MLNLIPLLGTLLDRVLPDPQAQADAKLKLLQMAQNGQLAELTAATDIAKGQIEVNKVEAQAPDLLTRGWRPSIGWCCSAGLFYQFLFRPIATGFGYPMPPLETDTLMTLLFGVLGLGAYRTTEKIKGVA